MINKIDYVTYLEDNLQVEGLTGKQRNKLLHLNNVLMQVEQDIKIEAGKLVAVYNRKVDDTQEWIEDYETEVEISFWLKETDPAFDEDRDNILVILREPIFADRQIHGFSDGINHNEFLHWKDHPMNGEFHCWLFHCLYDHTNLGWTDILRIGKIWIDINCQLQHFINLDIEEK